jgi:3D (Asp-Asp-Asp) domain-containing protein
VGRGRRRCGSGRSLVLGGATALTLAVLAGTGTSALASPERATRSYRLTVDAVAYHLPGKTASGLRCAKGAVAVDPKLIPLGTHMYVPGYGAAVAADVGTAVKGRIIDLWMPTDAAARKWGRKTITITVYR